MHFVFKWNNKNVSSHFPFCVFLQTPQKRRFENEWNTSSTPRSLCTLNNLPCMGLFFIFYLFILRQKQTRSTGGETDGGDKLPQMLRVWSTEAGGRAALHLFICSRRRESQSQLCSRCQSRSLVPLCAATLYYIQLRKRPQPLGNKGITGGGCGEGVGRWCNSWLGSLYIIVENKCCPQWMTPANAGPHFMCHTVIHCCLRRHIVRSLRSSAPVGQPCGLYGEKKSSMFPAGSTSWNLKQGSNN